VNLFFPLSTAGNFPGVANGNLFSLLLNGDYLIVFSFLIAIERFMLPLP